MLPNNFIVETNFPRHTVYLLDSLAALTCKIKFYVDHYIFKASVTI